MTTRKDTPFKPSHGTLVGTVEGNRGRAVHVVTELFQGERQVTIFLRFPPDAQHPEEATRIVAGVGAEDARELARLLMVAACDGERQPGAPPASWLGENHGDGAPARHAGAAGEGGGSRG